MKLADIKRMSRRQISKLPEATKRSLYTNLRRSVTQRSHAFERRGLKQRMPQIYEKLPKTSEASSRMLDEALSMAGSYLEGQIYTARGYEQYLKERQSTLQERLGLDKPLTKAQFDQYGRFMGDMQKRMGSNWSLVSHQAAQMFAEALRLNLKPDQFKRNFDYWSNHLKDLENARPIDRPSGVKPSDYIKQLHLETVTSWKNRS